MKLKLIAVIGLLILALTSLAQAAEQVVKNTQPINPKEIVEIQKVWCAALLDITATFERDGQAAAKELAGRVIDFAYAYDTGPVLFKPTLTVNPQTFRLTREGALSYFVGLDPKYPNDQGFALKPWRKCEPSINAILLNGNTAITMGKVRFTDKNSRETTVDKTWGYIKDSEGNLKIHLHHSSLEYHPK